MLRARLAEIDNTALVQSPRLSVWAYSNDGAGAISEDRSPEGGARVEVFAAEEVTVVEGRSGDFDQ